MSWCAAFASSSGNFSPPGSHCRLFIRRSTRAGGTYMIGSRRYRHRPRPDICSPGVLRDNFLHPDSLRSGEPAHGDLEDGVDHRGETCAQSD